MSDVRFADVLRFTKLALPQNPSPEFICDVVDPTTIVVKDVRGKEPVDVVRVSDDGTGKYVATRTSVDPEYDRWFRAVAGNVAYVQGEISESQSKKHLGI